MCLLEFERSLRKAGTSFKAWNRASYLEAPDINARSWEALIMYIPWSSSPEGSNFWREVYISNLVQHLENEDVFA